MCVSRRAYGSKIRSRHSSGMPGPFVGDTDPDAALGHLPVEPGSSCPRRRVLDGVLEEVLEDLAEAGPVGQGEQRMPRVKLERDGGRAAARARR